jgi:hypothetical protein
MLRVKRHRIPSFLRLGLLLPLVTIAQDQAGETVELLPQQARQVSYRDFYELKTSIEELRRQMNRLRTDVEAYKSRELTPEVYRTILRQIRPPQLTHEIILTNGTVVRGNLISENMDQLTLETSLGNLTLDKSMIRDIKEITDIAPKLEFLGDAEERIAEDHRIYVGKIRNTGITRADFVRIVFRLWNAQTELVAVDSAFVNGTSRAYLSGVVTDTSVEPGKEVDYRVRVAVDREDPVSYITREIHWDHID